MLPTDPEARAASSCGAAAASPAAGPGADDAQFSSKAADALGVSKESLEAEISAPTPDNSSETQTTVDAVDGTSLLPQQTSDPSAETKSSRMCSACGEEEAASERGLVHQCTACQAVVHASCYGNSTALKLQEATADVTSAAPSRWRCDCCAFNVPASATSCVYCCQPGAGVMRSVDTTHAFWLPIPPPQPATDTEDKQQTPHFAHLLCITWDPRCLASRSASTTENEPSTTPTDLIPAPRPVLPPGDCCLCGLSSGVRLQCRRIHCDRFFHAMCASKNSCGFLERIEAGGMTQVHAYCDRHRSCREDVSSFLDKLVSKPVTSLVGREDARRFQVVLKRVATYTSIETLLEEVASILVSFCNKGLRASRTEPPTYSMKHLQVLQLFLDHVPQLERTYAVQPVNAKTRVGDAKLYRHLVKTFNPPRYLSRFPGPLSQQHVCAVCLEPFFERQHVFYCLNSTEPHEIHWQCTKHGPPAASTGSSSKKKKLPASNSVWSSLKQPVGLSSLANGVTCGVCASPVDLRGLIASSIDANRPEFEEKPSVFAVHGCFINTVSQRRSGRSSRVSSPARTAAIPSSRASVKPSGSGPRSSDSRSSRRLPVSISAVDSAKTSTVVGEEPSGPLELAPLKMDRINVQRTARWLACVGQIIRLAGRPRQAESEGVSATETTEASLDLQTDPSRQIDDEPMPDVQEPQTDAVQAVSEAPAPLEVSQNGSTTISTSTESTDKPVSMKTDVEMEDVEKTGQATAPSTTQPSQSSLLSSAMLAYFDEATRLVSPFDPYALSRLETAREMLANRSGPGVAVLRALAHEYTRFVHVKHLRAVDKVRAEKRKREELEAQRQREREKKRVDREEERELKKKMLAMRQRPRASIHEQA